MVGTLIAAEAGTVEIMVGEVRSAVAPVVKPKTYLAAKPLPAALCAAVLMVAV